MSFRPPMRRHALRRRATAGGAVGAMAAVVLLLALVSPLLAPSTACAVVGPLRAKHVVLILMPFLTWDDVTHSGAETLAELALSNGRVANMNAITADPRWPNAEGGALTIGAGRWAASAAGATTLDAIAAANAGSLNPPQLGALGQVLHDAGLKTAAIGSVAHSLAATDPLTQPAVLAAMDAKGHVDIDVTDESALATARDAPFGVASDSDRLAAAASSAIASGAAFVVVDPGDLERQHDAAATEEHDAWSSELSASAHSATVRALDAGLREILAAVALHPDTLVIVLASATDKPYYQPPYFGPVMMWERGVFAGELTSSSTHRLGLVTNLDVAPTVLSALGLEPTATMIGAPMESRPAGPPIPERSAAVAHLAELGSSVGAIDYVRDLYFIRDFARLAELVVALVVAIALIPALRRLRAAGFTLLLVALSAPAAAWLLFAFTRYPLTPTAVWLAFAEALALVAALAGALALLRHTRPELPLLALASATSLLICIDQWLGHPFESGLFSYSIRAGWRYYGMGNEGAALLVGASILAVGIVCDLAENPALSRILRLWLMPVVGIVCLLTSAASFLGANAGVAVWGVFAYGAAWARLNGVRFTWKTALALTVIVVLLVAALAAVDMSAGKGETHIGRFFSALTSGEFSAVGSLVVRKAANNISYLPQTPYTLLCIALLAGLAALWWLAPSPLATSLKARPGVSAALMGLLVGGVVATVTEDSGVVMPALMLFAGALPMLYLALADLTSLATRPDIRS